MAEVVGVIGMGKMGSRIAKRLACEGYDVISSGHNALDDVHLADVCKIIIIAIKQKDLKELSEILEGRLEGKLVISIVAGKNLQSLHDYFNGAHIARAMTNIAVEVKEGMSAFCTNGSCDDCDKAKVMEILSCLGQSIEIEESMMGDFTQAAGAGTGINAHWMDLHIKTLVERGFSIEQATAIVTNTMKGCIKLKEAGIGYLEQKVAVRTRDGVTDAELRALDERHFDDILKDSFAAGVNRGRELNDIANGVIGLKRGDNSLGAVERRSK